MLNRFSMCFKSNTEPKSAFWSSVNILLTKPHVVNKRLWGSRTWIKLNCKILRCEWSPPKVCNKLKSTDDIEQFTQCLLEALHLEQISETSDTINNKLEILIVELFPKNFDDCRAFQLIFIRPEINLVTFYNITPDNHNQKLCPEFTYTLKLDDTDVTLIAFCGVTSKSYLWLTTTVLPQFVKWGEESSANYGHQNICNESLALVSKKSYYFKYNQLKVKYGKDMVKIWPECTDPSKFVYEDVAIATYLLLLWEGEKGEFKKQYFVDLGCGNGLLVYILTKEGHEGVGIDIRKRNIWNLYPNDVKLKENTIVPSEMSLFPEANWIIGNHSDELTPWIPVIAARSSYYCNYFLLPCCAYNFDGTKYQRRNTAKSQYTEYLEYIKGLSVKCGFNTDVDRLKIPSTKRICLIGKGRLYPEGDYNEFSANILLSIGELSVKQCEDSSMWSQDFKARDKVEKVKNCTQIDKKLVNCIINIVSNYLLEGCILESNWSNGRSVEINELVQLLTKEQLKVLKSECGGIQTLLKNHHYIFNVKNGKVQLRYPKTIADINKDVQRKGKMKSGKLKFKQKSCWFYNNHPQGCPLQDTDCSYLHVR